MLKKLPLILFVLLIALTAFSCAGTGVPDETGAQRGDAEASVPDRPDIIGTWTGRYSGDYSGSKITFAMRDDGTGYVITNGYIRTFTFDYNDGNAIVEYDSEGTMLPVTAVCRRDGNGNILMDFGDRSLLLSDRQNAFITDGLSCPQSLVGVWAGVETTGSSVTYTFNGDGTGEYFVFGSRSAERITWSANGNIIVIGHGVYSTMYEYSNSEDTISMLSAAAPAVQLVRRYSMLEGIGTDPELFGMWRLTKLRQFINGDPNDYAESAFVNDYRIVFSSDGICYQTEDNTVVYRYDYGVVRGGEYGSERVLPELYLERMSEGFIYHSYAQYEISNGELIIYGVDGARIYTYFSDCETAVPDFGIPTRLIGTWLGQLVSDTVSGTVMLTVNDDGSGRLVLDSDDEIDYICSDTVIAVIYKNENRGYIFGLDILDDGVRLSYRKGTFVYLLARVNENGGVWEKWMVDDRLYGSWGLGTVKYVFNDDGTGYISAGTYKYNFNYMAADGTIVFNVFRTSANIASYKSSYSFDGVKLIIDGSEYTREEGGDTSV